MVLRKQNTHTHTLSLSAKVVCGFGHASPALATHHAALREQSRNGRLAGFLWLFARLSWLLPPSYYSLGFCRAGHCGVSCPDVPPASLCAPCVRAYCADPELTKGSSRSHTNIKSLVMRLRPHPHSPLQEVGSKRDCGRCQNSRSRLRSPDTGS